ncbi:hypothetical protein KUTeg_024580 [Tegillarca granosa]|uniref:Uncharacterized protein n=1 Tax=Tegillarca granosa TaxID=220873 RepID=A0ABQ9E1R1_TEGGR|nr:hypothetical protein KUTeg_024580 [Tegillarca granosa]
MDAILFKSLKECDAKKSWSLVKDIVCIQLMGEDVIPVPYLDEATHYDIGAVVLKEERTLKQRLQKVKASAISVGALTKYIVKENVEGALQNVEKSKKSDGINLNPDFVFEESDKKNQDRKSIRVELKGCEKHLLEKVPDEGYSKLITVNFFPGFENLKKLYLIYEVYYVDEVKIVLTINEETNTYHSRLRVPIGFRLVQYKLTPECHIGPLKYISGDKWRVFWLSKKKIRLPMDKLPPLPKEKGKRLTFTYT